MKYEGFTTTALIKAIQRTAVDLAHKDAKKKYGDRISAIRRDLSEMRAEIIPRLTKLNRYDPSFFPRESRVLYHKLLPAQAEDDWSIRPTIPDKHGTVMGHDKGKVLVQFEGEPYWTMCEPVDLTLKFIRHSYEN